MSISLDFFKDKNDFLKVTKKTNMGIKQIVGMNVKKRSFINLHSIYNSISESFKKQRM